jgi:hypothetical protein
MATQPVLDPAVLEACRRALLARRSSGRGDEDIVLTRVRGSLVWDVDGCEYIDCTSQASSNNLGASDPRLLEAAIEDDDLCAQSRKRGLHVTARLLDMQRRHPLIGDLRCPGRAARSGTRRARGSHRRTRRRRGPVRLPCAAASSSGVSSATTPAQPRQNRGHEVRSLRLIAFPGDEQLINHAMRANLDLRKTTR